MGISEEDDDTENIPPAKSQRTSSSKKLVRHNVASKVNLNEKVTPRSIAYAAVMVILLSFTCRSMLICGCQLHFNLQTATSWARFYGGFDYRGLYNYIVDVFEDTPGPAAKRRAKELLHWWSR
jgi:uncharacterized protein DUF6698